MKIYTYSQQIGSEWTCRPYCETLYSLLPILKSLNEPDVDYIHTRLYVVQCNGSITVAKQRLKHFVNQLASL